MKNQPIEQQQPELDVPGWLAKLYALRAGARSSKHYGLVPTLQPTVKGKKLKSRFENRKATNPSPRKVKARNRAANKVARRSRKVNA